MKILTPSELTAAVAATTKLTELRDLLNSHHHLLDDKNGAYAACVDFCSLPTFGGTAPASTEGIYSYDETHVLIQGGVTPWEIESRN